MGPLTLLYSSYWSRLELILSWYLDQPKSGLAAMLPDLINVGTLPTFVKVES